MYVYTITDQKTNGSQRIPRRRKEVHGIMKVRMDDKQRAIAKTVISIFSACLLIAIAVWRWNSLVSGFKKLITVLAPILIGLITAYLMNPLSNWFEERLGRFTDRKKPHPRLKRALAVGIAVLILLLAIFGLVAAIVPEVISSIKNLFVSLPEYLTSITDWINEHIASLKEDQPQMYSVLISAWDTAQSSLNHFANQFEPKLDSLASGSADLINLVTSSAATIFTWLKNFVLGIIIAIYLLYSKESYQAQAKKFLYAVLSEERANGFLKIGSHVSYTFMHFLSGKTLDSIIIGLICFIGMTILQMPYITLISILVGVTNIIPFFGPFIGAVPSGFLILLSEPRKVIPFVIFILVLQQFDGNILGPKILGDTLGLPMFWILFAIIVGGGLFGFIGMVAFVPLFAAVYTLFSDFLSEQLHKKGLPAETEYYLNQPPPEDEPESESKPEPEPKSADTPPAETPLEETSDESV